MNPSSSTTETPTAKCCRWDSSIQVSQGNNKNTVELWPKLPSELIAVIAECLTTDMADYIRFRAVCKLWRSSTVHPRRRTHPPQPPWLLYHLNDDTKQMYFITLSDGKQHSISLPTKLDYKRPTLSYNGWLVLCGDLYDFNLLNPITCARLRIPSVFKLERVLDLYFETLTLYRFLDNPLFCPVTGIATNCSPDSAQGCTIVMSMTLLPVLVSWRKSDNSWAIIDDDGVCYDDVIYFEDKYFTASLSYKIVIFDSMLCKINCVYHFALQKNVIRGDPRWRLVKWCGSLLMMRSYRGYNCIGLEEEHKVYSWEGVSAYMLMVRDGTCYLEELKGVGDEVLFLGGHCRSVSLPVDVCSYAKRDGAYLAEEYHALKPKNDTTCIKARVYSFNERGVKEFSYKQFGDFRKSSSMWHCPCYY